MADNGCSNPFAIALVFYFNYRRIKLTAEFILKLIKKYNGGTSTNSECEVVSSRLLSDLKKKYDMYDIPAMVSYHEIIRVLSYVEVPPKYYPIFSISKSNFSTLPVYDSAYDILNQEFQPDKVLQNKCLYSKYQINDSEIKQYDNLSKLKHLIPGFTPLNSSTSLSSSSAIVNTASTITSSNMRKRSLDHIVDVTQETANAHTSDSTAAIATDIPNKSSKNIHILHRIAQHSIVSTPCISKSSSSSSSRTTNVSHSHHNNTISTSSLSVTETTSTTATIAEDWCLVNSPFRLLYDVMRNKALCRIYLRRHPK